MTTINDRDWLNRNVNVNWVRENALPIYNLFYAVARKILKREDAEDAAQTAYIKLLKYSDTYQNFGKTGAGAWLSRIAFNAARDIMGKKKPVSVDPVEFELNPDSGINTPEEELATKERNTQIYQAMQNLHPGQEEALRLRFLNEMKFPEMAEKLGISINTALTRVYRGKKHLEETLKEVA